MPYPHRHFPSPASRNRPTMSYRARGLELAPFLAAIRGWASQNHEMLALTIQQGEAVLPMLHPDVVVGATRHLTMMRAELRRLREPLTT